MKGDILKKIISIFLATVMMASSVIMVFAKPILKGDTNGDGKVTAIDSRNILLVVSGKKTISDNEKVYYDVNGTGFVTAIDASYVLQKVAEIKSDEYYVEMVQAWYFATALAMQWDSAVLYLTGNKLDEWVHNKTIQKAVESYRISPEQKEYLKKLKRKP